MQSSYYELQFEVHCQLTSHQPHGVLQVQLQYHLLVLRYDEYHYLVSLEILQLEHRHS